MSNGKDVIILLIAGLIKRSYKMNQYFPLCNNEGEISVKLDLSNYATKTDLKNISNVDVSSFALKTN